MNNKFDELTKSMAQSIARRAAIKRVGLSLAGMALACFALANEAHAAKPPAPIPAPTPIPCQSNADCPPHNLYASCCYAGVCRQWSYCGRF